MHDQHFPDSPENPDRRTDRALDALRYEERAGLGFRRRQRTPLGDPWADPERHQLSQAAETVGGLWAGYLAGFGMVLGITAIFYRPLLLGFFAVLLSMVSLTADNSSRVTKYAMLVAAVGTSIGMLVAVFLTGKSVF